MQVNIYAEEMTDRVKIIGKEIDGHTFTGCRFYIHRPGDDDSAAVTFWGKRDLRPLLRRALALLDEHYGENVT